MVEPDSPQTAIWRIRFGCWISKTTDTHAEYEHLFFPTATIVMRTRLNVTCISTLPLLY